MQYHGLYNGNTTKQAYCENLQMHHFYVLFLSGCGYFVQIPYMSYFWKKVYHDFYYTMSSKGIIVSNSNSVDVCYSFIRLSRDHQPTLQQTILLSPLSPVPTPPHAPQPPAAIHVHATFQTASDYQSVICARYLSSSS